MSNIKSISIPSPCHQPWQQMEQKEQGRHCLHCSKTVIDFSVMTSDEIIGYLANKTNVCGRFGEQQLTAINRQLNDQNLAGANHWKKWLIAASFFGAGIFSRANGQTIPASGLTTKQMQADSARKVVAPKDSSSVKPAIYHVSGVVIGVDDKLPVVGASVRIKGTDIGAVTDIQGRFQFTMQKLKAVLVISYIGYEKKEIKVSFEKTSDLNVTLKINPAVSGLLDITTWQPANRVEMLYQYMPWPINRLFK